MQTIEINQIPIKEIRVSNPRSRSQGTFQQIVASIGAVGLKKPITVSRRKPDSDGTQYDLVCGQGRMEAYLALGEGTIPAVIIDAPREQQFLMSLVENIARRGPSNRDLFREVRVLRERKYTVDEISKKLGLHRTYIFGIVRLLEHGEEGLVRAVEGGHLPLSVAVEIAGGNDKQLQRALEEAYENGELRGAKLVRVKRIIANRLAKRRRENPNGRESRMTPHMLVREYQHHVREQKKLIEKARLTRDRLLMTISAIGSLLRDDHFVALIRAEGLADMPEQLASRIS
jgi:ParB family chromosome partitioning protein